MYSEERSLKDDPQKVEIKMKAKKKSLMAKSVHRGAKAKISQPAKKATEKESTAAEDEVMSNYQYPGETHPDEQMVNPNLRMRKRSWAR